ncbi:hypothetical protein BKA63DRAFT_603897 [Paraphoma chrysanthemicola]|nr:hypothetical protein BKA63DRAFT_603897 [Paraphoma chrysanthemicola]
MTHQGRRSQAINVKRLYMKPGILSTAAGKVVYETNEPAPTLKSTCHYYFDLPDALSAHLHPSMPPHLIVLDVSGRKFQTQKATLQTSPYFQNLLARWDNCTDQQEDGSYYIDADPDVFRHVLDFMRRPSKFPLFWTKETGFDYALYNKLEAEADYFLLHDLRDWIRSKRYADAVKMVVGIRILSEHEAQDRTNRFRQIPEANVQSFFGSYSGEKPCINPCLNHKKIERCDLCLELLKKHGPQYEEPAKKLTLVIKRTIFDHDVCSNDSVA